MAILTDTKYEADNGDIFPISMTAATFAAAGTPPTGGITENVKATISKGNKDHGLRPRKFNLTRIVGTSPNQQRVYASVPILTLVFYNDAANTIGASFSYDGETWTITSKQGEDYN